MSAIRPTFARPQSPAESRTPANKPGTLGTDVIRPGFPKPRPTFLDDLLLVPPRPPV